jgi:hypothetical protein
LKSVAARNRLAAARAAAHHRYRSGRRPGTEVRRTMEAVIGIALMIIALVEMIVISRVVISNTPR